MSRRERFTLAMVLVATVPGLAIPSFFAGLGVGLAALIVPLVVAVAIAVMPGPRSGTGASSP